MMSDFWGSFLTPPTPSPSPLNPIFTFYNPIFWDHFRPPLPPKIGHHLWTLPDEEGELSDLEDFTLRTVESLEVDAMLDKFSPIKGKNKSENSGKIVASTPMKKQKSPKKKNNKKNKTENEKNKSEVDAVFLELSGEAESMPQLFPTHYFNILNLFGIGCKNYNVSTVAEQHGKYMQTQDTVGNSSIWFVTKNLDLV